LFKSAIVLISSYKMKNEFQAVVSLIFAADWRNSGSRCIISGNLTAGGSDDLPERHF